MIKSNAKVGAANVAAENIAETKKKAKVIALASLDAASWNVRTGVNDAAIQGLAESMKANGLLQAVVVMVGLHGRYTIIDGHRRVEAAKVAGWTEIDCVVRNVDERTAMVMTLSANLQRLESDPIKEAEAFDSLKSKGSTDEEIAASVGKSVRYVVRRTQLVKLGKSWKKAAKEQPFTTDALERIAAYEKKVQSEVFDGMSKYELKAAKAAGDTVSWRMIKRYFESRQRTLLGCPFRTNECATCPMNTANKGCLFPDLEADKFGTCTNAECFEKKWDAAIDAKIERLRTRGLEVKKLSSKWSVPGFASKSMSATNTVPYVVKENNRRYIWFGEPMKAASTVSNAETADEAKAVKEARRKAKEEKKKLAEAKNRLSTWYDSEGRATLLKMLKGEDDYNPLRLMSLAYALRLDFFGDENGDADLQSLACVLVASAAAKEESAIVHFYRRIERVLGWVDISASDNWAKVLFTCLYEPFRKAASAEDFAILSKNLMLYPPTPEISAAQRQQDGEAAQE